MVVRYWQELVDEEDFIVHLGDVFFSSKSHATRLFQQLPGRKILFKGNHDKGTQRFYDVGFERVLSGNEWTMLEDRDMGNIAVVGVLSAQDFVHSRDSAVVYVSHAPVSEAPTVVDPWGPYLYGHEHDNFGLDPFHPFPWGRNVCIELTNMSPISLVDILDDERRRQRSE